MERRIASAASSSARGRRVPSGSGRAAPRGRATYSSNPREKGPWRPASAAALGVKRASGRSRTRRFQRSRASRSRRVDHSTAPRRYSASSLRGPPAAQASASAELAPAMSPAAMRTLARSMRTPGSLPARRRQAAASARSPRRWRMRPRRARPRCDSRSASGSASKARSAASASPHSRSVSGSPGATSPPCRCSQARNQSAWSVEMRSTRAAASPPVSRTRSPGSMNARGRRSYLAAAAASGTAFRAM